MGHKINYNNHLGAYIAAAQNSTGANIISLFNLQALVNNLLVCCESKLRPLNNEFTCPAAYRFSAYV